MSAPHDTDVQAAAGKLLIAWVSTIVGMELTQWAALFAIIYTVLQIYILVRDKIVRRVGDDTP